MKSVMVWTYFIQAAEGGPIKIGFTSKSAEERLAALQTGSPVVLKLIGLLSGNREHELHEMFAGDRKHGEWFDASARLVRFITENSELTSPAQKRELNLKGRPVQITAATKRSMGPSWFDLLIPNDENICEALLESHEWGDEQEDQEEEFGDAEIDFDNNETEYQVIQSVGFAIEGEQFIESVGINLANGLIGFMCGPCNSHKRLELLRRIGSLSDDMDHITGHWFFFAVFWDGFKQVGVNLRVLAINGMDGNHHLFDPAEIGQNDTKLLQVSSST